jgi:hypothetical protein
VVKFHFDRGDLAPLAELLFQLRVIPSSREVLDVEVGEGDFLALVEFFVLLLNKQLLAFEFFFVEQFNCFGDF